MFDLEIYNVKPKYTNINFIKAVCGNSTTAFNMEIRLVEGNVCKHTKEMCVNTEGNVCKHTKYLELQNQIVARINLPPWEVEIISTYFSVWLLTVEINS